MAAPLQLMGGSPPFVSVPNQGQNQVMPGQMVLQQQQLSVMHPSMLPPPPSPKSLGIHGTLNQLNLGHLGKQQQQQPQGNMVTMNNQKDNLNQVFGQQM
jgi:hypothetical protein